MSARRLARGGVLALLAASIGVVALGAAAPGTATPVITSLDSYLVTSGQTITVSGDHFYTDAPLPTDNCNGAFGSPSVVFTSLDNAHSATVQPQNYKDSTQCSNTMLKVQVPATFSDGTPLNNSASILVNDCCGNQSSPGAYRPIVTIRPSAGSPSPSSGDVTVHSVSVGGTNLQPASFVAGSVAVTLNGAPAHSVSWRASGFSFDPANTGGAISYSFQVVKNVNNATDRLTVGPFGAGTYVFHPPSVSGPSPTETVVGGHVTVSGQYLGNGGSVTVDGKAAPVGWSASGLDVTVPSNVSDISGISVSVNGWGAPGGSLTPLTIDPLASTLSPQSAVPGAAITITGYNFGSDKGVVTMGGSAQSLSSWSPDSITFTLGDDVDSGAATVSRQADGKSATTAAAVTVVPKITQLEQTSVQAGSPLVIDGVGFGSSMGSITLAGRSITPQLWSRKQVLIGVPTGIAPGHYKVALVAADGTASVNQLPLTIAPPPPTPKPGSSAAAAAGNPYVPHFDNKHDFVKPIPPPSPVKLTLDAEPKKAGPGGTSTLTVTLTLNGKPVNGAQVKLSVIYSPCTGDSFSAPEGTTDGTGTFRSTITLCNKPGQHVILAESGVFSDQDAVDVTAPAGKTSASGGGGGQVNPASGVPTPLLALGAVAAALVGVGVYVNLRSHGWI